jgi:hypothetical protein
LPVISRKVADGSAAIASGYQANYTDYMAKCTPYQELVKGFNSIFNECGSALGLYLESLRFLCSDASLQG